jgi:hypothetical protein
MATHSSMTPDRVFFPEWFSHALHELDEVALKINFSIVASMAVLMFARCIAPEPVFDLGNL